MPPFAEHDQQLESSDCASMINAKANSIHYVQVQLSNAFDQLDQQPLRC